MGVMGEKGDMGEPGLNGTDGAMVSTWAELCHINCISLAG